MKSQRSRLWVGGERIFARSRSRGIGVQAEMGPLHLDEIWIPSFAVAAPHHVGYRLVSGLPLVFWLLGGSLDETEAMLLASTMVPGRPMS